jgi:uncharacterized repeat protein (TIGR03803 family)
MDTNGRNYTELFNFNNSNGSDPNDSLTLSGKNVYGMTVYAGLYGHGCIFSLDTNGSNFNDLFDFNGTNGSMPYGSFTISAGVLYGMTQFGGVHGPGTIFRIDTNGNHYKDLFDFNVVTGAAPLGSLILSGNILHGMTDEGGEGYGNIFAIDTDGNNCKRMFHFNDTDGRGPYAGDLTISENVLYGMTETGGEYNYGVIFKIDTITIDLDSTLSINELPANRISLNIYPNPNNGSFTLSLSNINENCNIEIYKEVGEKVLTEIRQPAEDNLINLCGQPDGVYLYRVLDKSGTLLGSGKIIIDR